jgi:hypothetical protein
MRLSSGLGLFLAAATPGVTVPDAVTLLTNEGALTAGERAEFDAGRPVVRVIDTPDRAEVMTLSAIRVRATAERFLACARDVSCLHKNEDALQAGRLGSRPTTADLATLSLDKRDSDSLAHCEVGRCLVRLSADAIRRFKKDVDWSSPESARQAEEVFRAVLADAATRYAEQGDRGLMVYQDDGRVVSVETGLNSLLGRRFFLFDLAPELRRHLVEFPASTLKTDDDYLCWYREKFWRKTVTALNHVTVYEKTGPPTPFVLASSKQLYASHFYESAVELLAYFGEPIRGGGTIVYLNRTRADIRPGGFTWLERVLIRRLTRGRLENQLRLMKGRLEQGPAAPPTSP